MVCRETKEMPMMVNPKTTSASHAQCVSKPTAMILRRSSQPCLAYAASPARGRRKATYSHAQNSEEGEGMDRPQSHLRLPNAVVFFFVSFMATQSESGPAVSVPMTAPTKRAKFEKPTLWGVQ